MTQHVFEREFRKINDRWLTKYTPTAPPQTPRLQNDSLLLQWLISAHGIDTLEGDPLTQLSSELVFRHNPPDFLAVHDISEDIHRDRYGKLPYGWELRIARTMPYYVHYSTKTTQWERPLDSVLGETLPKIYITGYDINDLEEIVETSAGSRPRSLSSHRRCQTTRPQQQTVDHRGLAQQQNTSEVAVSEPRNSFTTEIPQTTAVHREIEDDSTETSSGSFVAVPPLTTSQAQPAESVSVAPIPAIVIQEEDNIQGDDEDETFFSADEE